MINVLLTSFGVLEALLEFSQTIQRSEWFG